MEFHDDDATSSREDDGDGIGNFLLAVTKNRQILSLTLRIWE